MSAPLKYAVCLHVQDDGVQRTFCLGSGESETLKVAPARKVLNISTFSKGGSIEKIGNVINLYFEGNWMPIKVLQPHVLPAGCCFSLQDCLKSRPQPNSWCYGNICAEQTPAPHNASQVERPLLCWHRTWL